MIILAKATINTNICLTLQEKVTLDSPVFLFEFTNTQSKASVYCIAADTSDFPNRYNKFTITETVNPVALSAEVELTIEDFWHYTVYEQESATNLDPANATGIVEQGIVRVTGTDQVVTEYNSQDQEYTVYNG